MPVDKVTATQYVLQLQSAARRRNQDIDVSFGPVLDTAVQPQAVVLEAQNDRLRLVSLLLSLTSPDELEAAGFGPDIEALCANEGVFRSAGAPSTVTLTLRLDASPTFDRVLPRGWPLTTTSGVVFQTTEQVAMLASAAASYFNPSTGFWEVTVPAESVASGAATRVGPNQVTRFLRGAAFTSVTNLSAAVGGSDRESLTALIERYLLAVTGRQLSTAAGLERDVRAGYPEVQSVALVYGADPLLERAGSDAGAVDIWIKGRTELSSTDSVVYLGLGQVLAISRPPLVTVASVTRASPAATYVEGVDYEVVYDAGPLASSPRAVDGIRFLPGGTAPTLGQSVTISYTYDNLPRALQAAAAEPESDVLGRDPLFRRGIEVPMVHTAQVRLLSGFTPGTVLPLVRAAVLAMFANLDEGDPVETSDIQGAARSIPGVDKYVITRITRADVAAGTVDIELGANEFATLADADYGLVQI